MNCALNGRALRNGDLQLAGRGQLAERREHAGHALAVRRQPLAQVEAAHLRARRGTRTAAQSSPSCCLRS